MSGATPRRVALGVVGVLAVAVLVNVLAGRRHVAWDLTAERSATLSAQTIRVIDALDRRVRITAFYGREDVGRVEAATLLSRYRRRNRRIAWKILDPALHPGDVQRLGAEPGSAVVEAVDGPHKAEVAQYASVEIDVTSALARLQRSSHPTVCFTSGHGERAPDDTRAEGLSQAAKILRDNGYALRVIDLLADPRVPEGCEALVVAAPASTPSQAATDAIVAYLRASGKAFVLADPSSAADVTPLTVGWGIVLVKGLVVEGDPSARLPDEPFAPIVHDYGTANPSVRGLGPTFFPTAMGIDVVRDPSRAGLTVGEIAFTSRRSYLETDPRENRFDPATDRSGPIAIGAAADDSSVAGAAAHARIERTRIAAWADVDFATNAYIGEAANARLVVQTLDWLTQPEALVTAVPNFPKVRELALTDVRSRYILFLTAAVVPGLFLLAGAMVWAIRRGR
jgi:hypothetical protein